MPKLSVVLSVHNQKKFLKESIYSILNQSFSDFELLIVDDASSDGSGEIIKKLAKIDRRIRVLKNRKRLGLTKSLNKALKLAKSKYTARMDADDIALPQRFKKQVEFLENNPQFALVGSWAILIDKEGRKIKLKKMPVGYKEIYFLALKENPFLHPTLMFRREILEKIGGYNEDYLYAQDYELILKILKDYKGENLPEPLLLYRVGNLESISVSKIKQQEKFALQARWEALKNYPKWQIIYLIKPLLSFLLPAKIKLFFYKRFFWR